MPFNSANTKCHNIFGTAELLGVHERTIRYWIKKGWITPKRDYRNYPVFTDEDIKKIKKWRDTVRKS
jgi:DNA-binding transcriptional MerR regulator